MRKHWGQYQRGTWGDSYRLCLVCRNWRRAWHHKPLIHKGGKP